MQLFARPRQFFRAGYSLDHRPSLLLVLLCIGINYASGRIDQNIIRSELGHSRPGWDQLSPLIVGSWFGFWSAIVLLGVLGAVGAWYIGGWWYRVRLRWSGDPHADPKQARLVYSYASFVYALPVAVLLVLQTILYRSYAEAWYADSLGSLLIVVFPFLSCWVSYRGVRSSFCVRSTPAKLWFLVLPAAAYAISLGFIGALYAFFSPEVAV